MIAALSGYVAKGYFANRACYLCDIDENTLVYWKHQGDEDLANGIDSLYVELNIALKKAHAQAQARLIDTMMKAAVKDGNWLAAARTLESTDKENWWRTDKVTLQDNSKTINITRIEVVMPQVAIPEVIEGEVREIIEGGDGTP